MHVPVLPGEVLEWLAVRSGGIYVDGTAGAGGHAALIAAQLSPPGRLIALDRDPKAVAIAAARLAGFAQAQVLHANYGELSQVLERLGIDGVDGVLIDAGMSSMQLNDPQRGFSFQETGPLDMRMDTEHDRPLTEWLAGQSEAALADVLRRYGDVGPAGRIAKAIWARHTSGRLKTTDELTAAVSEGLGIRRAVPEETRTVFQALRIALNDELRWLQQGIDAAIAALRPGGRLVVISFHSGEDRVVKAGMQAASRRQRELWPDGRVKVVHPPVLKVLTPKPVRPGEAEVRMNPRAQSARLRAAERLPAGEEG